jgi:hypothetical protein
MSSEAFTEEFGDEKDWFLLCEAKMEDALGDIVIEPSELTGEVRSIPAGGDEVGSIYASLFGFF